MICAQAAQKLARLAGNVLLHQKQTFGCVRLAATADAALWLVSALAVVCGEAMHERLPFTVSVWSADSATSFVCAHEKRVRIFLDDQTNQSTKYS